MTASDPRRIVFFGSPNAAVTVVEALAAAGHEIVGVVTRPPRRRGRGSGSSPTLVEEWASRNGVPVSYAPADAESWCLRADVGVVVAYGRMIPSSLLSICPMLNVHFSVLPRWRGAAPVERAILAGDTATGVSIMELEETLDTGAVHEVRTTAIDDGDTTASLTERLAELGAEALLEVLSRDAGVATPQSGNATYAEKIAPDERLIDWTRPAVEVRRVVRALEAYTWVGDTRLKVLECDTPAVDGGPLAVGEVDTTGRVGTGDGPVRLVTVQPEGRRPMGALEWLGGLRGRAPVRLSSERGQAPR